MTTLNNLKDHLANGTRPLGALVYWRGLSEVRIPRSTFRATFEQMGLERAVGRDPKPEACLNMAASVAQRRQGKGGAPAQVKLKEKGTHAVYAVLMRRDVNVAGEERLSYIEEARVAVERKAYAPSLDVIVASDVAQDDAREALISEMVSEYEDIMANVRTQECSEALMAAMQLLGGLSLRPGVYFVPAANMVAVEQLKAFIEAHTRVAITAWTISASDANVGEARREAREALMDKVTALITECDEYVAIKGEDIGLKSINARVKRFQELEGQAMLYADILGDFAEQLTEKITTARNAFADAVLGADASVEADAA